jgi:hypothetical protein
LKKLFVILLAVALTLSLAAMASAATFSPYVGGEFQLNYTGLKTDADAKTPFGLGSGDQSMMKAYVQGRVEDADTNTWAQIGAKLTCWNNPAWDLLYSAGINKVGGILDISYNTDDHDTTLRGLTPFFTDHGINKYGGDPYFTHRLGGAGNGTFNFDVNTDSLTVNAMVLPNQGADATMPYTLAGTFKFDAGNVYVGYATEGNKTTHLTVGGQFKASDAITVSAQYATRQPDGGSSVSIFQGNVNFTELKLNATLMYDMKYNNYDVNTPTSPRYDPSLAVKDSVLGVGVEYTGLADGKFIVGGKYVADDHLTEAYGIYKFGIFDVQLGYAKSIDVQTDGFVFASLHAGMW